MINHFNRQSGAGEGESRWDAAAMLDAELANVQSTRTELRSAESLLCRNVERDWLRLEEVGAEIAAAVAAHWAASAA